MDLHGLLTGIALPYVTYQGTSFTMLVSGHVIIAMWEPG
jgi:hypothetical protein